MPCSQSSLVSDDDEELDALIYNSSRTAQRIRSAAAAEEKRASLSGIVGVQDPPLVSSLREEDSNPEIKTRNYIVGQSDFQQTQPQGKKRKILLLLQENSSHIRPAQKQLLTACSVEECTTLA